MNVLKSHQCADCHGAGEGCEPCNGCGWFVECPLCSEHTPENEEVPCAACRAEWAREDARVYERAHAVEVPW